MRTLAPLTVISLLLLWPPACSGAEPEFEPFQEFEIAESIAKMGQPAQSRVTTFFTTAELPWTQLSPVQDSLTELQGFAAAREEAVLDFHGKKLQAMKITWKREPTRVSNIPAALIRLSVSREVPTPPFPVSLGRGEPFWVPPGCVEFEIVDHKRQATGGEVDKIQESLSVSGQYKQATTYEAGGRGFAAHEFTYMIPAGQKKGNWTVTLSRDVPGGVCSVMLRNDDVEGGLRLVAITEAPLPKKLEAFADAGFAFAPPDGYSRIQEPPNGELVRFANSGDAFIAIGHIELGKPGLEALRAQVEEPPKGKNAPMKLIGFFRAHHVAGSQSFDAKDAKTGACCIFTEHAGHGYRIEISGLEDMEPDRIRSILSRWRWMTTH